MCVCVHTCATLGKGLGEGRVVGNISCFPYETQYKMKAHLSHPVLQAGAEVMEVLGVPHS